MEPDSPKPPAEPAHPHATKRSQSLYWIGLPVLAAVIVALVVLESSHGLAHPAAQSDTPATVAVAKVTREDLFKTVSVPAEFRPYLEVELHAKVSGFVNQIKVDFGDQVKSNQLLATLEVPELRDQLHSALAAEHKAQADYTNAHQIYLRELTVNREHTNLIPQQEVDTAQSKELGAQAAVDAARADREKFETMVKYTQITAPFDGVITRRYADPGSLIQAGTTSDTQSMPLVRLSDNYRLRMDFYVDADLVKDIHVGDPVDVRVDSLAGRAFTGKISRCTYRVEQDTRKMTTEIEVPNPKLELVPGMYATVVLKLDPRPQVLTIPAQAVSAGRKPTVYVVNDNQQIEEREVTLGLETPDKWEVTSGLKEGELVLVGSRALARVGEKVEPKLVETEPAL